MQYTWSGDDGSYADPANWTPQGVPLYGGGASALIQSGTVTLSDTAPNDIPITLAGTSEATQPNLVLDNAALGPGISIGLVPPAVFPQFPGNGYATITVDGYDTNYGNVLVGVGQGGGPDFLKIEVAPFSQLNQEGTIRVSEFSQLQVSGTDQGPATLNNDGTINVAGGSVTISADIIGLGTIAFLTNGTIELGAGVAATQHIAFSNSPFSASQANFRIDSPSAFHGIIDGFTDQLDRITLANTQATAAYFAQVTPDSGALLLLNDQEVVGALTITGTHASNAYGVSNSPDGSVTVAPPGFVPGS